MQIGIIGAGKWGQALAFALSQKNSVLITSRTPRDIPNFVSLNEALSCEYLVIAIPAQQVGEWLRENFEDRGQKILVAAKGIEARSGNFLNAIYEKFVDRDRLAFLSGPSFATEVRLSLPTAVVVNSHSSELANEFASFFPNFMKSYVSDDVIGAEIAGAYKNVIAIAGGVCEGLKLGNNARASLISRGLVEMMRFGKYFGAREETFVGLSGSGDLFLTANSNMSRNFRVGLGLGIGRKLDDILDELGEVAEGVYTAEAIVKIAKNEGIYTPIASEVLALIGGKLPQESLSDLLSSGG